MLQLKIPHATTKTSHSQVKEVCFDQEHPGQKWTNQFRCHLFAFKSRTLLLIPDCDCSFMSEANCQVLRTLKHPIREVHVMSKLSLLSRVMSYCRSLQDGPPWSPPTMS
ncbi:unnamed protein product [Rangifer tarandus platyrhynchus]|uniref:Uncharacterized protein n=2 Tax=Rangifer tarandus platyrhynchus TaxID=3082113 RepID=A0AC59YKL0_RANTA|nr:unnamed protein product [Rangifer tarandus platyrhynchus]